MLIIKVVTFQVEVSYQDVYILSKLYSEKIYYLVLYHTCQNTFLYRGIEFNLDSISAQLIDLKN